MTVLSDIVDPTTCKVRFYVADSDVATAQDVVNLRTELEWATARWAKATKCDIAVGAPGEGIAVQLVAAVYDAEGNEHPGWCGPDESGQTVVQVTAGRSFAVLPHEMGHALSKRHGHIEAGRPKNQQLCLMETNGGQGIITADDLEWVCTNLNCQGMDPEEIVAP